MNVWLWVPVLIASVWAAHWGAEHLAKPLKKFRKRRGFSVAAGGALIGLAAASPEIGINITSAVRNVGDIGLGTMLGSNVIAIPLMVVTAYLATRHLKKSKADQEHQKHLEQHLLKVEKTAVTVQALPYLAIVAIIAVLTLPAGWRGLQPIDGWIMLGVYILYLTQALLRGKEQKEKITWKKKEVISACAGLAVLAIGAYFTVRATENIVAAMGISKVVGGLFITAPMAALPEVFATWSVAKSGQITSSVTSVIGDHAVTLTVAFFPLALIGVPVNNFPLFTTVLCFVALVGAAYALFIHMGSGQEGHGFSRWQIFAFILVILIYVGVLTIGILDIFELS